MSRQRRSRTLCIGYRGGVGQALCALLAHHPDLLQRPYAELLLLDEREGPDVICPPRSQILQTRRIDEASLYQLLRDYEIDRLIDCSTLDTSAALGAAAAADSDYLSTSIAAQDIPTHTAIERLYADAPNSQRSLLVASGMNPGVVNALATIAIEEFAVRAGTAPTPEALQLRSLLITEKDTTESLDGIERDPSVFALTWGPGIALEELYEPEAFHWQNGVSSPRHPPAAAVYRARCGTEQVEGLLVPHEEVFTLGPRLGIAEQAFIYGLPQAAQRHLLNAPEGPENWQLHRLAPPQHPEIRGIDRVGVLLVSERFGELWLGFDTAAEEGLPYGTNGTLLQVAAGVIAGWNQLGRVEGLHVVEDLDAHAYVDTVTSILGSPTIVYDAEARYVPLTDRRIFGAKKRQVNESTLTAI